MKRRIDIGRLLIILLPVIVAAGLFVYFYTHPLFMRTTQEQVELLSGSVDPKEAVRFSFLAGDDDIKVDGKVDTSQTGTYPVTLSCRSQTKTITYTVVDTTPPELILKSVQTDTKQDLEPKQFVKECNDASQVTYSFKEQPTKEIGDQAVVIVASDAYGNTVEKEATLTREEDKIGPTITGTKNVKIRPGESIDLNAGIEANDDMDTEPQITIDDSGVDYNTPGEYVVVYVATDRTGNETRKEITLTVEGGISQDLTNGKVVYLTFDDGPSNVTPEILRILDAYNVKATFFVTGNGGEYNDYIKQAYKAGHAIGLHSYTHDFGYIYSSVENYFEDLNRVSDLVESLIGIRPNIIRFAGGSSNTLSANYAPGIMTELTQLVIDRGYYYFDWNVDSQDASGIGVDSSIIVENAASGTEDSLVILMHDAAGKETTAQALPQIIEYYQAQGYTFATLNEYSPECHHPVNN